MFHIKPLLNILYPPFCVACKERLQKPHNLCDSCQYFLACSFDEAQEPYKTEEGLICPLFKNSRDLQSILKQMEAPWQNYLLKSLASLTLVKLKKFSIPFPSKNYTPLKDYLHPYAKRALVRRALSRFLKREVRTEKTLIYVENLEEKNSFEKRIKRRANSLIWVVEK